jgi:hypothetical protein
MRGFLSVKKQSKRIWHSFLQKAKELNPDFTFLDKVGELYKQMSTELHGCAGTIYGHEAAHCRAGTGGKNKEAKGERAVISIGIRKSQLIKNIYQVVIAKHLTIRLISGILLGR